MSFEIEDLDILIDEIKRLQEENETLVKDNRELRDLCCFLDDERRQFKRLFKEWQKNVASSRCSHCFEGQFDQIPFMESSTVQKTIDKSSERDERFEQLTNSKAESLPEVVDQRSEDHNHLSFVANEANTSEVSCDESSTKLKEISSIYENIDQLTGDRCDLKAILDELCSIVLKSS